MNSVHEAMELWLLEEENIFMICEHSKYSYNNYDDMKCKKNKNKDLLVCSFTCANFEFKSDVLLYNIFRNQYYKYPTEFNHKYQIDPRDPEYIQDTSKYIIHSPYISDEERYDNVAPETFF